MKLNRAKGRMFKSVTHTATYYHGCDHFCLYCWAKAMGISHQPKLVQTDEHMVLRVRDAVIFLNSAHDSFAGCIPAEWIRAMLRWIGHQHPSNKFLLQTKNPWRMLEFQIQLFEIKDRVRLGTTLETDSAELIAHYSKAPPIRQRIAAMLELHDLEFELFLSLEPLMAFNPEKMRNWILSINPVVVEVGLNNWGFGLPEPSMDEWLMLRLSMFCAGIEVIEKSSMRRLRK